MFCALHHRLGSSVPGWRCGFGALRILFLFPLGHPRGKGSARLPELGVPQTRFVVRPNPAECKIPFSLRKIPLEDATSIASHIKKCYISLWETLFFRFESVISIMKDAIFMMEDAMLLH